MPLILIIIGLTLIIYNYRAIKKEEIIKRKNENLNISFENVLQDNKDEISDYKIEIGILRKDIGESLTELQKEIVDIKNNLNTLKNSKQMYENKENLKNADFLNQDNIDDYISSEDNGADNQKTEDLNQRDIDEVDNDLLVNLEENDDVISEIDFSKNVDSNKTQSIKKLLEEGLTEEEICHKLSVSKGEVILVKDLFKK